MMTKAEIFKEYVRVIEMCEGTNLTVAQCWRADGYHCGEDLLLSGIHDTSRYDFAYGIIESRPVFEGDTLYHKDHGYIKILKSKIIDVPNWMLQFGDVLSWVLQTEDLKSELKRAKEDGKRIAYQVSNGEWIDINDFEDHQYGNSIRNFDYPVSRYKIVNYDYSETKKMYSFFGDEIIYVTFTKNGITGKNSAKVTYI